MSSQFAQQFSIPTGFPSVLKDFTREVLRGINMTKTVGTEAADICAFAVKFFEEKTAGSSVPALSENELLRMARILFVDADQDNSGALDANEVKAVITQLADRLGFNRRAEVGAFVEQVMAVADVNQDGVVDYNEFMPVSIEIVQTVYAQVAAREANEKQMIHELIDKTFAAYDPDKSGYLDAADFLTVFKDLVQELGFAATHADQLSQEILDATDTNADGKICKAEFTPLAVDLVSSIIDEAENNKLDEGGGEVRDPDDFDGEAADLLVNGMDREELQGMLEEMFRESDADGSGTLDREEFATCLREFQDGLMSEREVDFILEHVDTNGDGSVDFHEFAPTAFNLLLQLTAASLKEEVVTRQAARDWDVTLRASAQGLVDAMSAEDLSATLMDIFQKSDTNGDGTLDAEELRVCLQDAGLGLNDDLVAYLTEKVDADADGVVTYREFAPMCYDMLVEVVKEELQAKAVQDAESELAKEEAELGAEMLQADARASAQQIVSDLGKDELSRTLMGAFQRADSNGDGTLDAGELRGCLLKANLGLGKDLIEFLTQRVDANSDGEISYTEFAPLCYELLLEVVTQEVVKQEAQVEEAVNGMSKEEVNEMVMDIFQTFDDDGNDELDSAEFKECLESSDLGLSAEQIQQLLANLDADGSHTISLNEFRPVAYEMIRQLVRESV